MLAIPTLKITRFHREDYAASVQGTVLLLRFCIGTASLSCIDCIDDYTPGVASKLPEEILQGEP